MMFQFIFNLVIMHTNKRKFLTVFSHVCLDDATDATKLASAR